MAIGTVTKVLNILLVLSLVGACTTTRRRGGVSRGTAFRTPYEGQYNKVGSKTPSQGHYDIFASGDSDKVQAVSQEDLSAMYVRLTRDKSPLNNDEVAKLSTVPSNPKSGSLEEAVLVLGFMKQAAEYKGTESFEETDLGDKTKTNTVSLENLIRTKGLNLIEAMTSNSLLQNFEIYRLLNAAVTRSQNSPEFTAAIHKVLEAQQTNWTNLNAVSSESALAEESSEETEKDPIDLSAADFRSGDSLLVEAQSLADNKRFADAITKASLIEKDSPLYEAAHSKIILFSNEAVQELREKAAQAFQSAIPMLDPKARAAYLEKAKSHLEYALSNYPFAPAAQLSTVRENLAVISKNLENLDPEQDQEDYQE